MSLVRGEATDAPDEAVWGDADGGDRPNALLMLDARRGARRPAARPTRRASASRACSPACGCGSPAGSRWARWHGGAAGDGRWQPFELEATGAARGEPWILVEGEEAELVEFLRGDRRPRRAGAVAWALARFEMGCGRAVRGRGAVGLPAGAAGAASTTGARGLALRVAVLCAEDARAQAGAAADGAGAGARALRDGRRRERPLPGRGRLGLARRRSSTRSSATCARCCATCCAATSTPTCARVADDLLLDQPEPFEIRRRR